MPNLTPARRIHPTALAAVVACALFSLFAPASADEAPPNESSPERLLRQELRDLVAEARDQVFPALVNIETRQVLFYGGEEIRGRSIGSGTIISKEGYVLTNYHVTAGGQQFFCTLADKRQVEATLVGEDPLTDLAVLQLDLDQLGDDAREALPVAELGDSSTLQVGDHVLAMGSPFALSRSVTLGIVSNVERVFAGGLGGGEPDDFELSRGVRTGLFTRWIQHDALINPGNSGGPLVSLEGKVVGINELGGNSIGFAIPSNLGKEVAAALIAEGEVVRSWIGASFKTLDGEGEGSQDEPLGARVSSLVEESPAVQAGLQVGDVLLEINGEPVSVRYAEQIPLLMKTIADRPVGSELSLRYRRKGEEGAEEGEATVVTERLDRDRGEEIAFRAWGITAQTITPKLRRDRRLAVDKGAYVSGVRSGSPAQLAEPPLEVGDVLLAVEGKPVESPKDLIPRYEEVTAPGAPSRELLVELDRTGQSTLTLLKSRLEDDENQPRELPKAWLGVVTQPLLRPLAEKLGLEEVRGFRITRVYPGSKAADSDLQVGDVITAVEGDAIVPRGMQDLGLLTRRIQQLPIGEEARLTIVRAGEELTLPVTLEQSRATPQEARRDRDRNFELVVREVTFFDRDERRWDEEVRGVLVDSVEPAGWAGLGGLRAGDLIQSLGGHSVRGLESYRKALEAVAEERAETVVVVVRRGLGTHFLALQADWTPTAGGTGESS